MKKKLFLACILVANIVNANTEKEIRKKEVSESKLKSKSTSLLTATNDVTNVGNENIDVSGVNYNNPADLTISDDINMTGSDNNNMSFYGIKVEPGSGKITYEGNITYKTVNDSGTGGYGIYSENSVIELKAGTGNILLNANGSIGLFTNSGTAINSGTITLENKFVEMSGIKVNTGVGENNGVINIKASGSSNDIFAPSDESTGMTLTGTGQITNNGLISLEGRLASGLKGNADGKIINNGQIIGTGNINKALVSYDGGHLENGETGEIIGKGSNFLGMSSQNSGELINKGKISIEESLSYGMVGIKVDEIINEGIIDVSGYNSTGIRYTQLSNDDNVINTGTILLNGTQGLAFEVDESIDKKVKSTGNVIIGGEAYKSYAASAKKGILEAKNDGKVIVGGQAYNAALKDGIEASEMEHDTGGKKLINNGEIIVQDKYNYGIHSEYEKNSLENNGSIEVNGEENIGIYYENSDISINNDGTLKVGGKNNLAFDTDYINSTNVFSTGNVLIDSETGSRAVHARGNIKTAVNKGTITLENGTENYAMQGDSGSTLVNNGEIFINSGDNAGMVLLGSGTIEQFGVIEHYNTESGLAILAGQDDSEVIISDDSETKGLIDGWDGRNTLRFIDNPDNPTSYNHNIDYNIRTFSHMYVDSGDFQLSSKIELSTPDDSKSRPDEVNNSETKSGNFVINKNGMLVLEVGPTKDMTGTVTANSLKIDGQFIYVPKEEIYLTKSDKIVVENVYTNNQISGTENVSVNDVLPGWIGGYELSPDGTNMSLVLTRNGGYVPDGFGFSINDYPYSNVDILLAQSLVKNSFMKNIDDMEYIHNRQISNSIYVKPNFSYGSYYGGRDKNAGFEYVSEGIEGGIKKKITENTIISLDYSLMNSDVTYKKNKVYDNDEDIMSYIGNLSAYTKKDRVGTGIWGSYGLHQRDVKRNFGIGDQITTDYDTTTMDIGIGMDTEFIIDNAQKIKIYGTLEYLSNKYPEIREEGDSSYTLNINPETNDSIVNRAGVVYERKNVKSNFKAEMGLVYFYNDFYKDRDANFLVAPDVDYSLPGLEMSKISAVVGLNYTRHITDRLLVNTTYNLEINKEYITNNIGVGFGYEF